MKYGFAPVGRARMKFSAQSANDIQTGCADDQHRGFWVLEEAICI